MANTFKFGNGNWAVKDGYALAYNDENGNFKPLPFDFTRASSATRVNRQGLIETVPIGKPRIDFTDNTSGHLLLEPSRLNNTTYSDGDISTFGSQAGSSSDADTPINGFENSIQIELDSVDSLVYKRDFTPTIGVEYTFSFFVQMDDNTAPLQSLSASEGDFSIIVNNGVATDASKIKTEKLGASNIYRVSATDTATSINNRYGVIKYSTQSNKGFRITGVQLEAGSYATSYIPTEGSSVTRVLDEANQTGVQQVIGQSEGTLYLEFVPLDASALQILFQIRTTGSTNVGQIDLRLQSGAIRTLGSDGGSTQFSFSGGSYTVGTTYKVAVRYKTNDVKLYINGSSAGSDTACSFTSSTKQQISFSENDGTNFPALAKIKDARLYDTALSDSDLQALTS